MSQRRTMLVPDNISSVERYFHFLLGYFVPALLWIDRTGERQVTLRDCGPMNPWFDLLRPHVDIELIPPGQMLRRYVSHSQPRVVLAQLDNPMLFHASTLRRAATIVRELTGAAAVDPSGVILLERGPGHPSYRLPGSEVPAAGGDLRSIANADAVRRAIEAAHAVEVIDAARLAPAAQVRSVAAAEVLVGQHGAGLANLLWMQAGTSVVEVQPPLRESVRDLFGVMAEVLDVRYRMVPQVSKHGPVEPAAVVAALRDPWPERETDTLLRGTRRELLRHAKAAELRLQRTPILGSVARAARQGLTGH